MHNKVKRNLKNPVVLGTLLLTSAGILGKIIGFFYKIFLSRTIGAEGLGIYQLIFPISTICFAITVAGLSTALSKYIAEYQEKDPTSPRRFLGSCLLTSTVLSLFCMLVLFRCSGFIAKNILLETRCEPLIRILAWSIPFASVHSCIHGYYFGKKRAGIPAVSSLIEQTVRVIFVYFVYLIQLEKGHTIGAATAVWGLVAGEAGAFLFCITTLLLAKEKPVSSPCKTRVSHPGLKLLTYSLPLSTNRLTLTLFATFESILIPSRLRLFGYNQTDALSIYGVLTGMALSVVMFPTVLTNSISVMILPVISEADSKHNLAKINRTIWQTIFGSLLLGSFCTLAFFVTGKWIGDVLFCNSLAGKFISMLSFICPFLFLSSILSSILHGLGMPSYTFVLNLFGSVIRILFVYLLIPLYGLRAYLMGMLLSQILTSGCSVYILWKKCLRKG